MRIAIASIIRSPSHLLEYSTERDSRVINMAGLLASTQGRQTEKVVPFSIGVKSRLLLITLFPL